jgi:hypothetical protein
MSPLSRSPAYASTPYRACFSACPLTYKVCETSHAHEGFGQLWPRPVVKLIVIFAVVIGYIVVLLSRHVLLLVSLARTWSVE